MLRVYIVTPRCPPFLFRYCWRLFSNGLHNDVFPRCELFSHASSGASGGIVMILSRLFRHPRLVTAGLAATAALAFLLPQLSPPAFASWCFDDPVVQVGNNYVETTIGIAAAPTYVKAHVRAATITYHLPSDLVSQAKVIYSTSPYFAESVRFVSTGVPTVPGQPIAVSVTVAFQTDLLGQVLFTQVDNTTQPTGWGAQTQPDQGTSFTTSSYGLTLLNLSGGGYTWSGSLPQN